MRNRDKLNVTIRQRSGSSEASHSSHSSEEENSNQFLNSMVNDSEEQSVALQTINQPSHQNVLPRRQSKVESVRSGLQNQNISKMSVPTNIKSPKIPEEKIDLNDRNQRKKASKLNSFQFKSPQPEESHQTVQKNMSSMLNSKKKKDEQSFQSIQEEKILEINKNKQKLNQSIHQMKDNFKELKLKEKQVKKISKRKYESPFGIPQSPEKEKEIIEFLHLKQKEKKSRQKKLEEISLKQEHKKNLEEKELEQLEERQKKRKLKELKQYSKFETKHEQWRQNFQDKKRQAEEVVKRYEGRVGYHIRALKIEEEMKKREKAEELRMLKERKQMYKSIDENQLQEHQRWHADKVDQLNYERLQAREEQLQRIYQENTKNNDLYHGNSHTIVQAELREKRKKKRQPKEKARRMKEYKQYIKKNFLPRTYQHRSLEPLQITERSNSHREVRRYRYYKGMAVGEIRQELPLPKSDKEVKKIGDNYLDYVKTLPKKIDSTIQEELQLDPEEIELLQKKFNGISRIKRSIHPIYDDEIKKVSISLTKNVKRDELQMYMMQLQVKDQHLKNKQTLLNHNVYGNVKNVQGQQKEINQGFVQNIEKKLALLAQL